MGKKSKKKKQQSEPAVDPYRVWLAGVGAAARADEGEAELFEELVERGRETFSARGKKVKKKFRQLGEELRDWFEETRTDVGSWMGRHAADAANRVGIPSAEAVEELTRRVEELTTRLEEMSREEPAAAAESAPEIEVLFGDGEWQVRDGGGVASAHRTKAEAVEAARAIADTRDAGVLVVYLKNGKVQSRTELS